MKYVIAPAIVQHINFNALFSIIKYSAITGMPIMSVKSPYFKYEARARGFFINLYEENNDTIIVPI